MLNEPEFDLEQEIDLARQSAERMLSRRDHARHELSEKLRQRGFSRNSVELVVQELEQRNWLDDEAFAARYAVVKAERLYGPQRIMMQLRQLGVEDALVHQAISDADVDWHLLAEACLNKRFSQIASKDPATRQKQQRYLYQRGYLPEHFGLLFR